VLYDTEKPDVVVDFTVCPVSIEVARLAVERGMSPVIGATGWPSDAIDELRQQCERSGVGAVMAPNFSLGAVLMVRFATEAARLFERAEIVELHDERKLDAPSGTSKLTATRIEEQTGNSVPIHSVRLPGLVAHQEVIFGGEGEALTIRHDSFSRSSFTLGVALAVRKVRELRSLVIGIDAFVAEELG